ncbi:MAG: nickel pincer cofactor biosynthesis protein LarC, partial [Cyclobacteriaceae bacterium]|nr:nickel pincer cofactor biosynthesis protein LarC [Cyclobacteriaceae bacterium]
THDHSQSHNYSHSHNRHLKDIELIIDEGELTDNAKSIAKEIFYLLGTAESKVHGVDINKIHFHEVGAIDSILDIVGTAFLLDKLDIDQKLSTPICTGHGFVMADHGRMPIPAPATKELLLDMPTYSGKEKGEMTTPTGAAILKYLNPSFDIPVLIEKKTGHGPGEKIFEHPNVLRLTIYETSPEKQDEIFMVETNIDDMSSELLGSDFQENLMKAGALDFYYTQIIMKKGRPGILVSAFVAREKLQEVTNYLLENTTTIGVRSYPASRRTLKRSARTIKTSMGEVEIKEVELPSGEKRATIEYESCRKIAKQQNRSISEIFSILNKEL